MSKYSYSYAADGTVMKSMKVGKQELITRATVHDIKGMSTAEKIAFSSAIKEAEAKSRSALVKARSK